MDSISGTTASEFWTTSKGADLFATLGEHTCPGSCYCSASTSPDRGTVGNRSCDCIPPPPGCLDRQHLPGELRLRHKPCSQMKSAAAQTTTWLSVAVSKVRPVMTPGAVCGMHHGLWSPHKFVHVLQQPEASQCNRSSDIEHWLQPVAVKLFVSEDGRKTGKVDKKTYDTLEKFQESAWKVTQPAHPTAMHAQDESVERCKSRSMQQLNADLHHALEHLLECRHLVQRRPFLPSFAGSIFNSHGFHPCVQQHATKALSWINSTKSAWHARP